MNTTTDTRLVTGSLSRRGLLEGVAVIFAVTSLPKTASAAGLPNFVYTSGYTGRGKGIYVYRMDENGTLTPTSVMERKDNPSFLALDPTARFLYACNENDKFDTLPGGSVSAFSRDAATGELKFLGAQTAVGVWPTHVSVHPSGKYVFTACYGTGHFTVLPVNADGSLGTPTDSVMGPGKPGPHPNQNSAHAHMILPDSSGNYVIGNDLGLDKTMIWKFDTASGKLTQGPQAFQDVEPGSGPRHFAFSANGKYIYSLNELTNKISVFTWDGAGGTTYIQAVSTLPQGWNGSSSSAEIAVHPSGKWLYSSNRGHSSIAVFPLDQKTGMIEAVSGWVPVQGEHPRAFTIDPTGTFLNCGNRNTNNLVTFRIDQSTGWLTPTGQFITQPDISSIAYAF